MRREKRIRYEEKNKKAIIAIIILLLIAIPLYFLSNKLLYSLNYTLRINNILSDDKEIERKWLIDKEKIPYDLNGSGVEKYEIEQTYLCFDPEMRVRRYNNGESYEYTIKTNMTKDGEGNTIHKTRYQLYDGGQIVAIDIFHEDLEGLAYMEIEFKTKEESDNYNTPDWVIKDVTDNVNYKNGHLARFGIPEE